MRFSLFAPCAAAIVCLLFFFGDSRGQEPAPKKRVAILQFDNPRLASEAPSGLFGADGENVGKGVSLQLIQKLLPSGKFVIVDQSAVEALLKEQKESDSERLDAYGRAANIGRLLGLDAMIIGAITRYGPDENRKEGALHSGVRTRKSKAYVEITVQVFNITTGEVMSSFIGSGESSRPGEITTIGIHGRPKTSATNSSTEMLSGEFVSSLLVEATSKAIDQVAAQLNAFAEKIPVLRLAVEGLVAEVAGSTLTLNVGAKSGVKVGDYLEVLRDPQSAAASADPNVVQPVAQRVGLATVTEVGPDYATSTFSGSSQPQVGDRVKRVENSAASPR